MHDGVDTAKQVLVARSVQIGEICNDDAGDRLAVPVNVLDVHEPQVVVPAELAEELGRHVAARARQQHRPFDSHVSPPLRCPSTKSRAAGQARNRVDPSIVRWEQLESTIRNPEAGDSNRLDNLPV